MQLIDAHKGNQVNIREDAIWEYLAQICHGLHYLHQKRILHRDIKARNIFLDGDLNVKVREKKKKKNVHPPLLFRFSNLHGSLFLFCFFFFPPPIHQCHILC